MTTNSTADDAAKQQMSLATAAARNLATTTKSPPQMQGISPRWLLKMLPWVEVQAGTFRVNRRRSYAVGDGTVQFTQVGSNMRVIPAELGELPMLRGFDDELLLEDLADKFVQRDIKAGDLIVEAGKPADSIYLVVYGKIERLGTGKYGDATVLGFLGDGDHFMYDPLHAPGEAWAFTAKALTGGTVLSLKRSVFDAIAADSPALEAHLARFAELAKKPQDKDGQVAIAMSAGHKGEPTLPGTFVDYELKPREYELSVAQTILRVHTRVADLYNQPMNQVEEQLRLTIQALRETQENELINNREFGLLANADHKQRLQTRGGPPTPDDMDELITRRRKTRLFLAHPRAIAAFGRECNKVGVYPEPLDVNGHRVASWRGVPIFPCNKIPITDGGVTSILAMRTGLEDQGVIGLHQTGIPEEVEPSLNVRFMGINEQAIMSYLVTVYFSAAILIPDALGVLENVEIGR